MKRRRGLRAFACWIVIVAQLALLGGCREDGGVSNGGAYQGNTAAPGSRSSAGLGEFLFDLVRINVAAPGTSESQARTDVLDARETEFVDAVDRIVPASLNNQTLGALGHLTDLISDGTIPRMTDGLEGILQLLTTEQQTLDALATLQDSTGGVSSRDHAIELAERFLDYPQLDAFFDALGDIVEANDGVDAQGNPNGEPDLVRDLLALLSRHLQAIQPGQSSQSASEVVETLLSSTTIGGRPNMGDPGWAVRADDHGNPRVAVDPATGDLYAPFVDRDGDGQADVDAQDRPVDANGQPVDIPAFAEPGSTTPGALYDADGKATRGGGDEIYVYYDAKETILSMVLMMVGDLIRADVPSDFVQATDTMLTRRTHDAGTPNDPTDDWETFEQSPLGDLAWSQLEMLKYADGTRVLWGLAEVMRQNPQATEDMLIAVDDIVSTVQNSQATTPTTSGPSMMDDMVPLLDRAFENQTNGTSAAREVLHAFRTQHQTLNGIPQAFADLMRYSDYQNQTPVAPGQKSVLEQVLDLMDEANGCNAWPFGNMAEFYIDAMAGNESVLGIQIRPRFINRILQVGFLRRLLCSRMSNNVAALQAKIDSGAMDAMMPIYEVFSDRGQTALLKDIFLTLHAHYDEVRPMEQTVADIFASGGLERLFDMLHLMNTTRIPQTNERVIHAIADLAATMVDDDRVVLDRNGQQVTSLLHLVTAPLDDLDRLASRTGADTRLDRAMRNAFDVIFARDANGELANEGIVDLVSAVMIDLADDLPVSASGRVRELTNRQDAVLDLLEGRDLVAVVDLLLAVEASPGRQTLKDTLATLFTPDPNPSDDIYGSLVRVLATTLESKVDGPATDRVLQFVGRAIDPARGHVQPIATGIAGILTSDGGSFLLTVLRNAVDSGPQGLQARPASILLDIIEEMESAAGNVSGPVTGTTLRADIQDMLDFMNDSQDGLPSLYRVYGYSGPNP